MKLELLFHGQQRVERIGLRTISSAMSFPVSGQKLKGAGSGFVFAGQHLEGCALASSVEPEKSKTLEIKMVRFSEKKN